MHHLLREVSEQCLHQIREVQPKWAGPSQPKTRPGPVIWRGGAGPNEWVWEGNGKVEYKKERWTWMPNLDADTSLP
jgi:hypothetical protein